MNEIVNFGHSMKWEVPLYSYNVMRGNEAQLFDHSGETYKIFVLLGKRDVNWIRCSHQFTKKTKQNRSAVTTVLR